MRTTPARLWLLTAAAVVAVGGLAVSAGSTLGQARDGMEVLGHDAGPQAMATTELYLALADMDAQTADVLLMGTDHELGSGREAAEERYEESRARANEALLQAASLTEGDTVEEVNVQAVLDGIGEYERAAGEALLLNDEAGAAPGEVDGDALERYREGSHLMHTDLMPKAFNLGLDSSAIVRANHEDGQEAVALGLAWVGGSGVIAVGVLAGFQLYLRGRFRRRLNAPLIAATAATAVLTVGVIVALNGSGNDQSRAKEEGLDAAMALSRATAVATDMQADQSRFLLDPEHADHHQQVYLERAQAVLFRPASDLEEYYEQVAEVAEDYPDLPGSGEQADGDEDADPGTLGYLGEDARQALLPAERETLGEVLTAYDTLQDADRDMRGLDADGDRSGAIDARMDIAHHEDGAFTEYTYALDRLIDLHGAQFEAGIESGERSLSVWTWLLPAGTVLVLVLIAAGVRPRLAEYR
ncbi:hypothetical protein [Nocardiopsis coralli]|uniref:hypothetical protein n=1 Tax=Nocardiopsis coralli TaxID=2772213 RepID=UPI001C0FF01E